MSETLPAHEENPLPDLTKQRALLKKHWGHDDFKPAQALALAHVLEGHDTLAILATGYGKSAIFQIAALSSKGCALVISPLIALMQDQVADCLTRGIPASYVNSQLDDDEVAERLDQLAKNKFKVFYIAPERINTHKFKVAVSNADINLIAVDEAHCVSRLGHDFRPAYQQIQTLTTFVTVGDQRPPVLAVTATATSEIETDVAQGCGMLAGYKRVVGDPTRANLKYKVWPGSSWRNLGAAVRGFDIKTGRYVIYGGTRKGCEKIVQIILEENEDIPADKIAFYHAGMDKEERTAVQNGFKAGTIAIVVATCAFGMGIDVPNIRGVVHFGVPGCVEDYVQESGRAGRDGKSSDVILICEGRRDYSVTMRQRFIEADNPPYEVFVDLWNWLHEVLQPAGVLALSGTEIANQLLASDHHAGARSMGLHTADARSNAADMLGSQVLGCLSTLEAYGMVRRGYMESGTSVEVDIASLIDVLPECSGAGAKLGSWLEKQAREFFLTEKAWTEAASGGKALLQFDRKEISALLDISETTFLRTLKALEGADVLKVKKVFKGKTTQIIKYGADLAAEVPRAKIDEKRRRAYARLEGMLAYMEAKSSWKGDQKTDEAYRDFLRRYFLVK